MGKKSKRNRSSSSSTNFNNSNNKQTTRQAPRLDDNDEEEEHLEEQVRHRTHPSLRTPEEETKDNLRFQDPFVEEYNYRDDDVDDDDDDWEDDDDDDDIDDDGNTDALVPMKAASEGKQQHKRRAKTKGLGNDDHDDDDDDDDNNSGMEDIVQTWNPFSPGQRPSSNNNNHHEEELEMDPSAYKMYHMIQNEWPSLSFDIMYDNYGIVRNKFPHTILCVCGTQAAASDNNSSSGSNHITVMKMSDLHRIHIDTDDDILGEEIDHDDTNDDDDIDDTDDDNDLDDEDVEPVIEHYSIKHNGGVNRIRIMKQSTTSTASTNAEIVASWSDTGSVYLYNIGPIKERFLANSTKMTPIMNNNTSMPSQSFFSYKNEDVGVEGYALDWSPIITGRMATGDCHGSIHLWTPRENGSSFDVSYMNNNVSNVKKIGHKINSVEDIQWSPTEATVLAAASANDGCIRIYDTRKPGVAMIQQSVSHHPTDINVLSWNPLVTNLLATGDDDGTLAVWDLRHFTASASTSKNNNKVQPLARFTPHTTPITSVEWHPTDESMLVASDDVGTYIYDLSVEEDDTTAATKNNNTIDIPPQLLFVHNGSEQFKEVHWHPQITSCVMTTALTGLSVFIPSNL